MLQTQSSLSAILAESLRKRKPYLHRHFVDRRNSKKAEQVERCECERLTVGEFLEVLGLKAAHSYLIIFKVQHFMETQTLDEFGKEYFEDKVLELSPSSNYHSFNRELRNKPTLSLILYHHRLFLRILAL